MTGGPGVVEGDSPRAADRAPLWLPLLRDLTGEVPAWTVLKNLDSAFAGIGDIDTMAPRATWPTIEARFRAWAPAAGLSVVGVCRHNRRGPNFLARRVGDPYLFILDVKDTRPWRFSTLVTVEDALAAAAVDASGYRRTRAGFAGTLKLLFNGTGYGGYRRDAAIEQKHVLEDLRADPEGALGAARLVGAAAPALRRGIRAAMAGGWSRRDMLAVEVWCAARGLVHPVRFGRQVLTRRTRDDRCPAFRLAYREGRRLPDDPAAWVASFEDAHPRGSLLGLRDKAA